MIQAEPRDPTPRAIDEIAARMAELRDERGDPEMVHVEADRLLIACLRLATLEWPTFAQIADDWEEGAKGWWWA